MRLSAAAAMELRELPNGPRRCYADRGFIIG